MKEIIREVSASPDDVLAAVREGAREWRESAIPPKLRKRGIVGVEARIRPPYVWLGFRLRFGRHENDPPVLRAAVVAVPGGAARIRGEYGRRGGALVAIALMAIVFPTIMWLGGDAESALIASALAFMMLVFLVAAHQAPRRPDPEADYLLERLEHALAAAEEKAAASRAITPARRP